jgi:Fic family protein
MNYDHLDIQDALERVDALRAEIEAERPIEPDRLGRAMQRLRLEWTYHSNAIEGNTYGYGETVALLMEGVTAHGKPLKDALDIQRHREVLTYLEGIVSGQERLSLRDIRGMHEMLMGETYTVTVERPNGTRAQREEEGGAFKQHPNHVLTPTGEVHYYARPEETPAMMRGLLDWYGEVWSEVESGQTPVIPFVADFHHRFVQIHPFPDGNGRLGRILMNLMLMQRGYVPAVLRQERRSLYYGALNQANAGDLAPLVAFVAEELAATMALYLSALRGEPDPGVFDRRVALLRRELESPPDSARLDQESLSRLAEKFVIPLFEKTSDRTEKLRILFRDIGYEVFVTGLDGKSLLRENAYAALRAGEWVSFLSRWRMSGLRINPSFDGSIHYRGEVGDSVFSLGGSPPRLDLRYEAFTLPDTRDAERIVDEVFGALLDLIDEAVKRARQA